MVGRKADAGRRQIERRDHVGLGLLLWHPYTQSPPMLRLPLQCLQGSLQKVYLAIACCSLPPMVENAEESHLQCTARHIVPLLQTTACLMLLKLMALWDTGQVAKVKLPAFAADCLALQCAGSFPSGPSTPFLCMATS